MRWSMLPKVGSKSDYFDVNAVIKKLRAVTGLRVGLRKFEARTRILVRSSWTPIATLAEALVQRTAITYEAVAEIVDRGKW
jgi:hypothetical protein